MRVSFASFLPLVALGVVTVSCTASLELDRFRSDQASIETDGATPNVNYFDVRYSAKSMESHLNEYFEMRIVDRNNAVQAKAIYNDVVGPDFVLYLAKIIPKSNAPYRLDFWADHNFSGGYTGIIGGINEKDHAWRRVLADPLPEDIRLNGARYDFEFLHDTNFVDIFTDLEGKPISGEDTLLPFELTVPGANTFLGKMMEIRVVESASGRLVGLYRQGRLKDPFKATITGILDEVTKYEVAAYVDENASGKFDTGDPSWKFEFTSNASGASVQLDTATLPQTPIETGEPASP